MSTLKQFLAENVSNADIDKAWAVVHRHVSVKKLEYMEPMIELLKKSLEANSIYNPDFEAIKGSLNHIAQTYNHLYYNPKDQDIARWYGYESEDQEAGLKDIDIDPYIDGGNYKKQQRNLDSALKMTGLRAKLKHHFEEMKGLLDAYATLQDALKSLKPHIIKGRKPAEPKENAGFVNRMGSKDSQELVRKHLIDGITPALDKYETDVIAYFESLVTSIGNHQELTAKQLRSDTTKSLVLQRCFTYEHESYRDEDNRHSTKYTNIKVKHDYHTWIASEAASIRKGIQEGFLHKNLVKLSMIVDKKGNLENIKDLPQVAPRVHGMVGAMETAFIFKFADHSSFKVVNKITVNYTAQGKGFNQFPTTFHDVQLPDGSKLAMPSEEKMVKVFAETHV